MKEVWRDIPGYEGLYQASNIGRVKNILCKGGPRNRIVKSVLGTDGYLKVNLNNGPTRKSHSTARLVLLAFKGLPEINQQAAHLNGNKLDNRTKNLKWASPKENCAHKKRHGTWEGGENNPNSKLSKTDVLAIRSSKESNFNLSLIYPVSESHIRRIKGFGTWRHI